MLDRRNFYSKDTLAYRVMQAREDYYLDMGKFPNVLILGVNKYAQLKNEILAFHKGYFSGVEVIIDTANPDLIDIGYVRSVI
jgi:hypothetical protein